ncbi:MAG: hypothetical protein WBD37_14585, partial [Anderseniella sp.]
MISETKIISIRSLAWMITAAVLVATAPFWANSTLAAERNEKVRFAAGASGAAVSDAIKGYDSVNYMLGASAGQTMQVLFSPDNSACYFNVLPSGSQTAIFNGSTSGNEFSSRLPNTGEYTVQVYMMRSAARRGEICRYQISFEIAGARATQLPAGIEDDADDGGGALAGAGGGFGGTYTRRDARRACENRMGELYGYPRSQISDVSIDRTARGNFTVTGKVTRHQSRPDIFNCRVAYGEVIGLRVNHPDKPGEAIGKAILGAVLLGTAEALSDKESDNAPYPAYARGNPFADRDHLSQACRHEIARNLRHSHAQFDKVRMVTSHLRGRILEGTGSIRWYNTDHTMHYTCHFDRRGQIVDGQFYYYPAEPAAYGQSYGDGNAGGPDNWRVSGVANNDVLYVHRSASLASPRIGSLPHNAR